MTKRTNRLEPLSEQFPDLRVELSLEGFLNTAEVMKHLYTRRGIDNALNRNGAFSKWVNGDNLPNNTTEKSAQKWLIRNGKPFHMCARAGDMWRNGQWRSATGKYPHGDPTVMSGPEIPPTPAFSEQAALPMEDQVEDQSNQPNETQNTQKQDMTRKRREEREQKAAAQKQNTVNNLAENPEVGKLVMEQDRKILDLTLEVESLKNTITSLKAALHALTKA